MASTGSAHKTEVLREATTMVLYLSIVLLATFTALPGKSGVGVRGAGLVALIWGTALGLTLAHWFAFRLAARAFSSGEVSRTDVQIGMAQVAAAFVVALLCTIPVLMFGDDDEIQMATWVPALIVGLAGYGVGRAAGRTKVQSWLWGGVVLVLGLAVASVKNFLAGY